MTDTPAAFLAKLGELLTAYPELDSELAKIVASHILTATPGGDAVEQATKAIGDLAAARALRPPSQTNG
jgi:hypothetical protein